MRDNTAKDQHKNRQAKYVCRLCRQTHPLRKCKRFLELNSVKRQQLVRKYGYCRNCLAHSHSQGTCFTTTGCKYCQLQHHSLLHVHRRIQESGAESNRPKSSQRGKSRIRKSHSQSPNPSPKPQPSSKPAPNSYKSRMHPSDIKKASSSATLSSILRQNTILLLPTVVVKIEGSKGMCKVRGLLDSSSRHNYISSKTVNNLRLATFTLNGESICLTTLISVHDTEIKINATLCVKNKITLQTPSSSLSSSIQLLCLDNNLPQWKPDWGNT
ncbi:uncharacterized protein LOC142224105 [Haematobia irritans]|uniref:uncharacterized protein LOC142224105 n=1 Tax=Haematobia irritans TaxID=7368 RepID=UPI003F50B89D